MKKMLATATLAASTCLALAACGGQAQPEAASAPSSATITHAAHVDASVVRGMTDFDFARTKSINEAARKATTVVVGEVVGWSDGRSMVESDTPAYAEIMHTAVLSVKVTKKFAGAPGVADVVHVEVPRGAEILVNGAAPSGTTAVLTSIEELGHAVPKGTRVILLANQARSVTQLQATTPGLVVKGEGTGVPAGAALLAPTVQGLLFRDETGAFASGIAEDEGDWGWLSPATPRSRGFETLVEHLGRPA